MSTLVASMLEERGVRTELFFNTEAIDPQARTITWLEGTALIYDLLVLVPRGIVS